MGGVYGAASSFETIWKRARHFSLTVRQRGELLLCFEVEEGSGSTFLGGGY